MARHRIGVAATVATAVALGVVAVIGARDAAPPSERQQRSAETEGAQPTTPTMPTTPTSSPPVAIGPFELDSGFSAANEDLAAVVARSAPDPDQADRVEAFIGVPAGLVAAAAASGVVLAIDAHQTRTGNAPDRTFHVALHADGPPTGLDAAADSIALRGADGAEVVQEGPVSGVADYGVRVTAAIGDYGPPSAARMLASGPGDDWTVAWKTGQPVEVSVVRATFDDPVTALAGLCRGRCGDLIGIDPAVGATLHGSAGSAIRVRVAVSRVGFLLLEASLPSSVPS